MTREDPTPTPEEATAHGLTADHVHARMSALRWAAQADADYIKAIDAQEEARRRGTTGFAHVTAEIRQRAQEHGVRSAEALKLAEMWARVARALADKA